MLLIKEWDGTRLKLGCTVFKLCMQSKDIAITHRSLVVRDTRVRNAPNSRRTMKSAVLPEYEVSSNLRQNLYLIEQFR